MWNASQAGGKARAPLLLAAVIGIPVGAALAQGGALPPGSVACPPPCGGFVVWEDCYYACCDRLGIACQLCTSMSWFERILAGC